MEEAVPENSRSKGEFNAKPSRMRTKSESTGYRQERNIQFSIL